MANRKAGIAVFIVLLLIYLYAFNAVFREYLSEETLIPAMIFGFFIVLVVSAVIAAKT